MLSRHVTFTFCCVHFYCISVFCFQSLTALSKPNNLTCCKYRKGKKKNIQAYNSLLSMTKIVHLYRFYCPFTPRGPEVPHGRGKKNGTFQMPATQSPMSIPKGKTAGQLLILCLINNVVPSFLTFTKRF